MPKIHRTRPYGAACPARSEEIAIVDDFHRAIRLFDKRDQFFGGKRRVFGCNRSAGKVQQALRLREQRHPFGRTAGT